MPDGSFKPISAARAREISKVLKKSAQSSGSGVEIDAASGQILGSSSVNEETSESDRDAKVNKIGKYDTHYE